MPSGESNVYVHGNLRSFVEQTGFSTGVLYVGDHVEADTRDPRRFGWRTAMILSEVNYHQCKYYVSISPLWAQVEKDVEVNNSDAYRLHLTQLLEAKDYISNLYSCRPSLSLYDKDAVRTRMLDEMEQVRQAMRNMFGTPWGSIFSSDAQSSLFGLRIYRWTDLYSSDLKNLLHVPLDAYLSPRSTTKTLPHDVRIVM
jgi:hypothetical protein